MSKRFLGESKKDVHHSKVSAMQACSEFARHKLAVYCLNDTELTLKLIKKLMLLSKYIEMSRFTGVPFNYLLTKNKDIRVESLLYKQARQHNLLVPVNKKSK